METNEHIYRILWQNKCEFTVKQLTQYLQWLFIDSSGGDKNTKSVGEGVGEKRRVVLSRGLWERGDLGTEGGLLYQACEQNLGSGGYNAGL